MFNLKSKKGFTLVELLVVVVIIGILTAIAIPVYNSVTASAQEKACLANMRIIKEAAVLFAADNEGTYPTKDADILPLIDGNVMPVCPVKGAYTLTYTATGITIVCADHAPANAGA